MSNKLYYRIPKSGNSLSHSLKLILEDDDNMRRRGEWFELDESDLPLLKGIIYGTDNAELKKDVMKLTEVIGGYGSVDLRIGE